nr:MAG TPA: hypothetical protein [Bacteriophage sp.]
MGKIYNGYATKDVVLYFALQLILHIISFQVHAFYGQNI